MTQMATSLGYTLILDTRAIMAPNGVTIPLPKVAVAPIDTVDYAHYLRSPTDSAIEYSVYY